MHTVVLITRLFHLSFSSLPAEQLTTFAVITLLWCLLWVQSLPLSLLSSFLLCVLCVLRVSWLWWTSLSTVGLTAHGTPLWLLCVSTDQGRVGVVRRGFGLGWAWREWIAVMMTIIAMASLVFCKFWCCRCLRTPMGAIRCFAESTKLLCCTNCHVLTIQRLQFCFVFVCQQ